MNVKKGNRFRCIRDVFFGGQDPCFWYFKGKIYNSDLDDCITDENGDINHRWGENEVYHYFIPYISNKRKRHECKARKML